MVDVRDTKLSKLPHFTGDCINCMLYFMYSFGLTSGALLTLEGSHPHHLLYQVLILWATCHNRLRPCTRHLRTAVSISHLVMSNVTPWTSPPSSSVHGILQVRILGWVAISFFPLCLLTELGASLNGPLWHGMAWPPSWDLWILQTISLVAIISWPAGLTEPPKSYFYTIFKNRQHIRGIFKNVPSLN